jgi:hypothetical protein
VLAQVQRSTPKQQANAEIQSSGSSARRNSSAPGARRRAGWREREDRVAKRPRREDFGRGAGAFRALLVVVVGRGAVVSGDSRFSPCFKPPELSSRLRQKAGPIGGLVGTGPRTATAARKGESSGSSSAGARSGMRRRRRSKASGRGWRFRRALTLGAAVGRRRLRSVAEEEAFHFVSRSR